MRHFCFFHFAFLECSCFFAFFLAFFVIFIFCHFHFSCFFHLAQHLIANTWYQGNQLRYQNFYDEALNKTLQAVCGNASQLNFEATVFSKMLEVLSKPPVSLKRKQLAN